MTPIDPMDLIGYRSGKLTVIEYLERKKKEHFYLCQCDCGHKVVVGRQNLRKKKVKSCGCLVRYPDRTRKTFDPSDIIGKRFERLTVKELAGKNSNGKFVYLCECDCGNVKKVDRYSLLYGKIKSCGCLRKELAASIYKKKPQKINTDDLSGLKIGPYFVVEKAGLNKDDRQLQYYCCNQQGQDVLVKAHQLIDLLNRK